MVFQILHIDGLVGPTDQPLQFLFAEHAQPESNQPHRMKKEKRKSVRVGRVVHVWQVQHIKKHAMRV